MKVVLLVTLIFLLFTIINMLASKSVKLNEKANDAIAATARSIRYFIYGVVAFLGFILTAFLTHFLGIW